MAMKFKKIKLGKYFFEFVSMFFAVIAAFGLNNWNDNRRDNRAEEKLLMEIKNGLELDLNDFKLNKRGHNRGLASIDFFKQILAEETVSQDSIKYKYYFLTGDNIPIMSTSGYESLKSKGFEIIKNDSIRSQITTIYENDYQILRKYEENTPMYQSFQNYFFPIDNMLAEYYVYNEEGSLSSIKTPLKLSLKNKNLFLGYLFRIRASRNAKLNEYSRVEEKVKKLLNDIEKELGNK